VELLNYYRDKKDRRVLKKADFASQAEEGLHWSRLRLRRKAIPKKSGERKTGCTASDIQRARDSSEKSGQRKRRGREDLGVFRSYAAIHEAQIRNFREEKENQTELDISHRGDRRKGERSLINLGGEGTKRKNECKLLRKDMVPHGEDRRKGQPVMVGMDWRLGRMEKKRMTSEATQAASWKEKGGKKGTNNQEIKPPVSSSPMR